MAEAAVANFLVAMAQLEIHHADLISGAENELKALKKDLGQLRAFLRDEAMKPKDEAKLRELKTQIKEVVYELEETVGACLSLSFSTAAKTSRVLVRHLSIGQVRLAKEVNPLREGKVRDLLKGVNNYYSSSSTSGHEPRIRLTTERSLRNDRIVGLEDDVETIIGYLMEESEKLDIISIIGKPGLGKTTLAGKVFEDERIACEFRNRAWVHVSRKFKIRDMFLCILKTFTSQDMSSLKDVELIENAKAYLKDEKLLLVLDDVGSPSDWEDVYKNLNNSSAKGKVLVTSCKNYIPVHVQVKLHNLRERTLEESWELLHLEVFGNTRTCPPNMGEVGKRIAGKCEGLPLNIVAVAGVLVDRLTENEWEMVSENLKCNDIISKMAELSYKGFLDDLRECFLYMGVFPQDEEISAWALTRMWIAEGLVQAEEGKSLEEIAAQNLDALITRNLVVAGKSNSNGKVKTCRVHDAIRDFCISESAKQNLFQEKNKLRSRVLEESSHDDPQVRSLFEKPSKVLRKLGILESKSVEDNKLIHLRYLTLKLETLTTLPESISQLWNLQTLVVEAKSQSITMKANVWRMIWLRHIKTNAAIVLSSKDQGIGGAGESLQTFNTLSLESCTDDVFQRARNLKALGVRGRLAAHSRDLFLEKFQRLEKLKLVNDVCNETATDFLVRLLQPNCLPPNIKSLTLSNTFLDWMHISNLAKIKTLKSLKLKDNAFTGIYWGVTDDCFPSLQLLLIQGAGLVHWEASVNSFPRLSCLVLKQCEKLNEIPMALAKKGLERLDIYRLRKSAVDSAKRIAEEIKQMQKSGNEKWIIPFKLSIGP